MLGNKHIIVALLVTPVLAILAWFAVGALFGEKAQQARPGASYPLVERSNCRYDSGQCDLRNEDLRLSITLDGVPSHPRLLLSSGTPLASALLAFTSGGDAGDVGDAAQPSAMLQQDSEGKQWALLLDELPSSEQRLRLAVQAGGSSFFAEASTVFLDRYRE